MASKASSQLTVEPLLLLLLLLLLGLLLGLLPAAIGIPPCRFLRALIMPAFEKPAIERLVPRMEAVISKVLLSFTSIVYGMEA